jgi:hypothetical protein
VAHRPVFNALLQGLWAWSDFLFPFSDVPVGGSIADELFEELDVDKGQLILTASRTGTHAELFDKKRRQKKSG